MEGWPPFDLIDVQGRPIGFGIDHIAAFNQRLDNAELERVNSEQDLAGRRFVLEQGYGNTQYFQTSIPWVNLLFYSNTVQQIGHNLGTADFACRNKKANHR